MSEGRPTGQFRRLAWSSFLAHCSEQVLFTAIPLIAVLSAGASAAETGWLQVVQTLPYFLLSVPFGLLVDRTNQARLMAIGQAFRVFALAGALVVIALGQLNLTVLATIGALCAIGTLSFVGSVPAIIPAIVQSDKRTGANTWLEFGRSIAMTAGPAAAGLITARVGSMAGLSLALATSMVATILFITIDGSRLYSERQPFRPLRRLAEGARIVVEHRVMRSVTIVSLLFNGSAFALHAILVAMLTDMLGASGTLVGSILGLSGTGMIAASLSAPLWHRVLPMGPVMTIGPICGLVCAVCMVGVFASRHWGFAALGMFIFGFGPVLWTINSTSLMQHIVPRNKLGSVSGLLLLATFGARPLGALAGTIAASHGGISAGLSVVTLGFTTQLLIALWSPIPCVRQPVVNEIQL